MNGSLQRSIVPSEAPDPAEPTGRGSMGMSPTPLQIVDRLGAAVGLDLRVKRDDLYPAPGGGNKARKMSRIVASLGAGACNALVTNGGLQSNHARVTALVAAEHGWPCSLVLHGDHDAQARQTGNLLVMRLAGARIAVVAKECIASSIAAAVDSLRSEGCTPAVIPGGGHCLAGALAYVDAVAEVWRQCSVDGWCPDWIVLASGTGATQAGVLAGTERAGWRAHVTGVSVARTNPRGRTAVEQSSREVRAALRLVGDGGAVDFRDAWVGAGYELADSAVFSAIRLAARTEGLILDPTYTGKAFAALLDMAGTGEIPRGSRVLFWHTGGLLNLMAASGYAEDLCRP